MDRPEGIFVSGVVRYSSGMTIDIASESAARQFGERFGRALRGGECLELVGDVGVGKTTFVKGLGAGLEVDEDVQSPSFTISRVYEARDGLSLHHYDFYRLESAGVVGYGIAESLSDSSAITVVEWGDTVKGILPEARIRLEFAYHAHDEGRTCTITLPAEFAYLKEGLA